MANKNFDPNARYNMGQYVAGGPRVCVTAYDAGTAASAGSIYGEAKDGVYIGTDIYVGKGAAGMSRANGGPHVAGAPRSINNV